MRKGNLMHERQTPKGQSGSTINSQQPAPNPSGSGGSPQGGKRRGGIGGAASAALVAVLLLGALGGGGGLFDTGSGGDSGSSSNSAAVSSVVASQSSASAQSSSASAQKPSAQSASPQSSSSSSASSQSTSSQNTSAYQVDSSLGKGDGTDTWTVLMYLCGSDLESTSTRQGGGQATKNLVELTKANLGQNVRFVIETGGAKKWQNNVVSSRVLGRYTIDEGKMSLVDQQPSASMAEEATLADFLKWGVANYPADHYMVVIWDHGGGSITGVCQDELYPYTKRGVADSLTLSEMRDAFKKSGTTFEVVGFDTCLMATLETAQILSPYAKYMVASEESEPGSGWDYTQWPSWLAAHPGTSGADLGSVICTTYYDKCASYRQQNMATLSCIDLGKIGKVSEAFEEASDDIARASIDGVSLRRLQQGAKSAESFGETGFYKMNMVDLGDLMNKTSQVVGSDAKAVISSIDKAVVHEVHGRSRASATGLSVFFPLQITNRSDFATYAEITDNTPYLQFLAVMYGVYDKYDWSKLDNYVSLRGEPVVEKDVKIKYKQSVNNKGHVQLDITKGLDQVSDVSFEMYVYLDQLGILCYLGSDNDLIGSYEKGTFTDNFQDEWLTIDGHYVSARLFETGEGYNLYYIPILLNDEQTGLVVEYEYKSKKFSVLCVMDEANQETGMAGKTGRLLTEGDKIQFLFPAENAKSGVSDVIPLETMEWHEDAAVAYEGLGDGSFAFRYKITDVLGNEMNTDLVYQNYKNGRVVK